MAPPLSLHYSHPFITDGERKKANEEKEVLFARNVHVLRVLFCLCRCKPPHVHTLRGPGGHSTVIRIHSAHREAELPKMWSSGETTGKDRPAWGSATRAGSLPAQKVSTSPRLRPPSLPGKPGHTAAPFLSHLLAFLSEYCTFVFKYQHSFVYPTCTYVALTKCRVLCWTKGGVTN